MVIFGNIYKEVFNMGKKIESAASYMEKICNDNSHGYSQQSRWPEQGSDFDCSSLVITCYEQAGVPVRTRGATYTGNMYQVFKSCGFQDVTSQCNLSCGSGLQRGDVLLNHSCHTALYLGNGRVGHARSSEGNCCQGDQSGNEIRTQSYWNYPWDCVLRYIEEDSCGTTTTTTTTTNTTTTSNSISSAASSILNIFKPSSNCSVNLPTLQKGDKNSIVGMLQGALKVKGYNIGRDGVDGDFGNDTEWAVKEFQRNRGLDNDGICGRATWNEIVKL